MRLRADDVSLAYERRTVVHDVTLEVPEGRVTVVVGPNGCGKSTLLRALGRLHRPAAGTVTLDGRDLQQVPPRALARALTVLPQGPTAPEGITVGDLVLRGRQPHQRWFAQYSAADEAAVEQALALTHLQDLRDRPLERLSGGQRQRAWLAMVLAQGTDVLLLDEPTTYLDLTHQLDVLDLVARLNQERGTTVVMVLHDLTLAARYAHLLVAMRAGRVAAAGAPHEVLTAALVREVFGLEARVVPCPAAGTPWVVPEVRVPTAVRAVPHGPHLPDAPAPAGTPTGTGVPGASGASDAAQVGPAAGPA